MGKGIRTALIALTALIVLICIYCLSFTFKVNAVENKAKELAEKAIPLQDPTKLYPSDQIAQFLYEDSIHQAQINYKNRYLDSIRTEKIFLGNTYESCKKQQLDLGLDLKGGMSVVLQVSLKELLQSISDKSKDPNFNAALNTAEKQMATSSDDYITLFLREFRRLSPNTKLADIFATRNNKDYITEESSDGKVENYIRSQSKDAINRTYNIIQTRIDQFGTKQPTVTLEPNRGRITVEIAGADNPSRVRKLLQATANLEFWECYKATEIAKNLNDANEALKNYLDTEKDLKGDTTKSAIASVLTGNNGTSTTDSNNSANPLMSGNKKADTSKSNELEKFKNDYPLYAVLQPAVDQQNRFQDSPIFGYVRVLDTALLSSYMNLPEVQAAFPADFTYMLSAKSTGDKEKFYQVYAIKRSTTNGKAPLDGSVITDARADISPTGGHEVTMRMNSLGATKWKDLTSKNVDRNIAVVLDNQVYSAPNVNEPIPNGTSSITGGFDQQEATDLANVLKTGKLPASARIIEEEVIGASLGGPSIRAGFMSMGIAFILIVLFMIVFYSTAGLLADIMLLLNVFLIIGLMAALGSTLTLPGIAGIVLTLGMAVDANVIIYERVKEELRLGKSNWIAAIEGFKHSLPAILDGNITTLLTGIILAWIGIGPVKGFAITLIIGILCTLYTAVLMSRVVVEYLHEKGKDLSYYTEATKNFLHDIHFDFIGKRKITYTISTIIIIAGFISFATRGFELGIDFKGGREYKVRFDKPENIEDVRNELNKTLGNGTTIKTFGSDNQLKIVTSYLIKENGKDVDAKVEQALYNGLKKFIPNTSQEKFKLVNLMSSTKIDPTMSVDFKRSSTWATILALVVIFAYILIRFRHVGYSVGAIAATAHDAFVVLAVFSIFHGILPFAMEVDQIFIAALLTIIGYSINDTVIIFDRLREYLGLHPNADVKQTMNDAINSTLSRTFNTAFTVFITVFILFLFGGPVLRAFSFAMLIGVVIGCYSSVFIASPIKYDLDNWLKSRNPKPEHHVSTHTKTANPKKLAKK